MKKAAIFSLFLVLITASSIYAQVTAIPDPEFEQALIDLEIDPNTTPDGQVMTSDIDTIESLNVSNRNISDLTGIEGFTSLTSLNCSSNRLSEVNLSANTRLNSLIISSNQLDTLDISDNVSITFLLCSSNALKALDFSQNDTLKILDCSNNQLTSLDLSTNLLLENLTCSANKLTDLDVSQNDSLRALTCSNNRLTQLNVSENDSLERLNCASNQLMFLDVSSNTMLSTLNYSFNLIRSLDLSNNTSLASLNSSNNLLEYLNISNENNAVLTDMDATDNPLLTCIMVDDVNEIGNDWEKDAAASYSESCNPVQTYVPDDNFEQALIDLGLDSGPLDDFVVWDSIITVTVLDVSGQSISDLTGIGDFVNLTNLNCSDNQLTDLDLTKNTKLTDLNCSTNDLVSLNLKNGSNDDITNMDARTNQGSLCIAIDNGFTPPAGWQKDGGASYDANCNAGQTFVPDDNFEQALIDLGLDTGPLDNYVPTANINTETSLDVRGKCISDLTGIEGFTALESLNCSDNILTALDITNNIALTELRCFSNYLPTLDVTFNTSLTYVQCGDNLLDSLDVSQNINLEELIVDSNFLTEIDITNNPNLVTLNINSNKIVDAGLDLTSATNLEKLLCSNNKFSTLDLSGNGALIELNCSANKLNALNLDQNGSIKKVNCSQNFITSLVFTNNPDLDTLISSSNQLTAIDINSNPLLRMLVLDDNNLASIDISNNLELRYFNIASNELTALDVTANAELLHLNSNANELEDLDVTSNANLLFLACSENYLSELDISQNADLLSLFADRDSLEKLNTDANVSLLELSVANNKIDSLDLSANSNLESLVCNDNTLKELDLQNNTALSEVVCSGNEIARLDLSLQPDLILLNCSSNQLTRLNLRNGENDTLEVMNAINNPDLLCIEVDDPNTIGEEWQKDDVASYSANCRYDETYVPDDNFESALAGITGEPDNNDDYILTAKIDTLTILDVSSAGISDLTGLQDFVALESLNVGNNSIDSIYLRKATELTDLNVSGNQLDTLDLSENALLESLDISSNEFQSIVLDSVLSLTEFICSDNLLLELDLSSHNDLTSVICSGNALQFLSMNNGNNASLATFDASNNPDLFCIEIDDTTSISGSWVKDDIAEYSENCHYNETYVPDDAFEQFLISSGLDYTSTGPLDDYVPTVRIQNVKILRMRDQGIADLTGIEDFSALTTLNCSENQISALDISNNTNLLTLDCSGNQLSELDISFNTSLIDLDVSHNFLTTLDISQNTELVNIDFSTNRISSLNILPNIKLKTIVGQKNQLFTVEANNGLNDSLMIFDLRNNLPLSCILVDDINAALGYTGWYKDATAFYKLECNDDDNDGVADADDLCPTTPFGDQVDLFGCSIFSLPFDNFNILTTSESCRTGNNGKINITASEIHPYVATAYGPIDTVKYEFFDKVEIRNVRAGMYQLCITIIGQQGFEQCFSLQITEPQNLSVFRLAEENNNGRVAYQLFGSDEYIVELNGMEFTTQENRLELELAKGENTISIKTPLDCQGVFKEVIYVSDEVMLFPNPFVNQLRIVTSVDFMDEVQVNIYHSSGRLVRSEKYSVNNGKTDIDTSFLSSGMYVIELSNGEYYSRFKAVKK